MGMQTTLPNAEAVIHIAYTDRLGKIQQAKVALTQDPFELFSGKEKIAKSLHSVVTMMGGVMISAQLEIINSEAWKRTGLMPGVEQPQVIEFNGCQDCTGPKELLKEKCPECLG